MVVFVEWLRVGGLCHHLGLFLIAIAGSWVKASEPRPSRTIVTNEFCVHVERTQVTLGVGKVIGGDMFNDEVASIDWLSDTAGDL